MNWKEKIKDKAVEIILGVLILGGISWCGSYLKFIPQLYKDFPTVQQANHVQDSCIKDLREDVNFLLKIHYGDSIKQSMWEKMALKRFHSKH